MNYRMNEYQLGDCCKFIDYRGKTPIKTNEGIPLVTAKIIKEGVIQKPTEFIAVESYSEWMRRGIPQEGDVIITTEAPLGEVAQIKTKDKLAFAQRLIILHPRRNILDQDYLYYLLRWEETQKKIASKATGTTVIGIKAAELRTVQLLIPPIRNQQLVAAILSSLDDKIELNNRMIANLEAQAQAIFKSWFVDFEPFQDGEFEESELGLIPKGWRVGTVSEVADINAESIKSNESDDPIEYLDTSNITGGRIQEIQKFENLVAAPSRARRRVVDGDIVYSTVRPNQLHYGMINNPSNQLLVSTGFAVVRCKENLISKYYVYLTLTQQSTVEYFQQLAETTTSTFPAIRSDDVGSLPIVIPLENVSKDYHDIVLSLYKDINSRYQQNSILQKLRDTLLPKLMSGEIEVPVEG